MYKHYMRNTATVFIRTETVDWKEKPFAPKATYVKVVTHSLGAVKILPRNIQ